MAGVQPWRVDHEYQKMPPIPYAGSRFRFEMMEVASDVLAGTRTCAGGSDSMFGDLQPGDIVDGRVPGCWTGRWTYLQTAACLYS